MGGPGTKRDALANSGTALNTSNTLGANAGAIYGPLSADLTSQMAHPSGYTPAQMAAQGTAAQQSAGGSNAATVGQGALLAARTRNAGAAQNAIAQGGRTASENLSKAAVGTQVRNADLQQRNATSARTGLESLYGTELGGAEKDLGLSNQAIQVAGQQKPGFWQQFGSGLANQAGSAITGRLFG